MKIRYFVFKVLFRLAHARDVIVSRIVCLQFSGCGNRVLIRSPKMIFGGEYICIGNDFNCFAGLRLEAIDRHLTKRFRPSIVIGDGVSINYDCHIGCINRVELGDGVLIASRVYISDHAHGAPDYSDAGTAPSDRLVYSKGPVIIEDNVWIGEGVCILPDVRIGIGSIVGANSVVTHDIPPYCIAAGVPCKVIRSIART